MYAKGFLHKTLSSVIHKKRLETLILLVNGLLVWKKLSVTELGRGLSLPIQERSAIRRSDRFIGNERFHNERFDIYKKHAGILVGNLRPKIIVDWSHIPNTTFHALRAALVAKGRALTLYEEVHPEKKLGNGKVEEKFLDSLSKLLPNSCKPIVITDAGFRNPWFIKVLKLDWDFVGRVRGTHKYYDGKTWQTCKNLLSKASVRVPKCIGKVLLCKKYNTISAYLYLIKEKSQESIKRWGYVPKHGGIKSYKINGNEPWLLASSLCGNSPVKIKRVIKIYEKRMQIEEGFRDLKSVRYGFGLRNAYSRDRKRIETLLLIAMFASLIAWIVGFIAEKHGWQYQFQVNSVKDRRILSLFFLGCQVIKRNILISIDDIESAQQEVWRLTL
jgi:hypothetical protein